MCACALTPDQEAWNKAHHVGEMNWTGTPGVISTSPGYPFNDKNYADRIRTATATTRSAPPTSNISRSSSAPRRRALPTRECPI